MEFVNKIIHGDCSKVLNSLPDGFADLIITSPPYFGCRQYGSETLGREADPRLYISNLVSVLNGFKRVLHTEGSFYLNVGDVYFGTKGFQRGTNESYKRKTHKHYASHNVCSQDGKYLQHKQLLMLPERIAVELQHNGWVLRNKIIWEKSNPVPNHADDRRYPVYEHIFHFVKSRRYYFDLECAKRLGCHRDIIRTSVESFAQHQASFPLNLITPLILTTSKPGALIFDPFMGSGTTALAALQTERNYCGIELNEQYITEADLRITRWKSEQPLSLF